MIQSSKADEVNSVEYCCSPAQLLMRGLAIDEVRLTSGASGASGVS